MIAGCFPWGALSHWVPHAQAILQGTSNADFSKTFRTQVVTDELLSTGIPLDLSLRNVRNVEVNGSLGN